MNEELEQIKQEVQMLINALNVLNIGNDYNRGMLFAFNEVINIIDTYGEDDD